MILDTNGLSAWFDGDPSIIRVLSNQPMLALPVIVLGEYQYGLHGSRLRTILEPRLFQLERLLRVLDITRETAKAYATVRSELKRTGKLIPANDAWIAALAIEHGMPVLSRDTHFDHVPGLKRVGW
ncbi:MAG: type II toxin-antitoxin system VapC family toxin [Planctomycetota bacterium]